MRNLKMGLIYDTFDRFSSQISLDSRFMAATVQEEMGCLGVRFFSTGVTGSQQIPMGVFALACRP